MKVIRRLRRLTQIRFCLQKSALICAICGSLLSSCSRPAEAIPVVSEPVAEVLILAPSALNPPIADLVWLWGAPTPPNVAGYRVAYGFAPGSHPGKTKLLPRTASTYPLPRFNRPMYFVLLTYNAAGVVLSTSNEVVLL